MITDEQIDIMFKAENEAVKSTEFNSAYDKRYIVKRKGVEAYEASKWTDVDVGNEKMSNYSYCQGVPVYDYDLLALRVFALENALAEIENSEKAIEPALTVLDEQPRIILDWYQKKLAKELKDELV
jgi:hypothetical protein